MRHYFDFDGVRSDDYGVMISGAETMGAPGRDIEEISVPGRHGNLTIDNGRFVAIKHVYPAYIPETAKADVQGLRNALMAKRGHRILSDTVHSDEFYRAYYEAGLEPSLTANLRDAAFEIEFTRDPRRFLVAGDQPQDIPASTTETLSGAVVKAENGAGCPAFSGMTVDIVPEQPGTGDPSGSNVRPLSGWTGLNLFRAGRNILPLLSEQTKNGVTLTPLGDGGYTLKGTASGVNGFFFWSQSTAKRFKKGVTYKYAMNVTRIAEGTDSPTMQGYIGSSIKFNAASGTYTCNDEGETQQCRIRIGSGKTYDCTVYPTMTVLEDDAAFTTPEYNTREAVDWTDEAGTVYGGTLDLVTGELTVTMANIALYNGETIGEPWYSSMDVYEAGRTPTTGAQVVYTLDTPLSYSIDPVELPSMLSGKNTVWTDAGDIYVSILSAASLVNPTLFASKPLIRVYGQGTLYIGGVGITVAGSYPYVDIDSEIADCYFGATNANAAVTISGDFPSLAPGTDYIAYTGFSAVEITPRWWRL